MVQFCWYYKKSEKVRFFLLWKSFLVSKWTNYQIIQGIRGDNTILDNLQPFCLLSEHSHILAMSISYVEGGTLCFWQRIIDFWIAKITKTFIYIAHHHFSQRFSAVRMDHNEKNYFLDFLALLITNFLSQNHIAFWQRIIDFWIAKITKTFIYIAHHRFSQRFSGVRMAV